MKNLLSRFDSSYIYAFFGELTLGLTLLLHIVLARVLGPDQFGLFAAAAALAAIVSLFIQFGFPMLAAREVAANPPEASKLIGQYLLLEGLNALPVMVLLFPISRLLNFEGQDCPVLPGSPGGIVPELQADLAGGAAGSRVVSGRKYFCQR